MTSFIGSHRYQEHVSPVTGLVHVWQLSLRFAQHVHVHARWQHVTLTRHMESVDSAREHTRD